MPSQVWRRADIGQLWTIDVYDPHDLPEGLGVNATAEEIHKELKRYFLGTLKAVSMVCSDVLR